ncbi:hypothetical protein EVG20_g4346 [Dentipellis fragilis]|uniref:Phosphatidic acid phosphatase type 2/haloperoxidase domain-containing protein n=1 Tax=Dentipellis fragilis TaxID=205917 RepID=A0A4Y9YWP9_9AGAM|nr:hypothetical protein EVG20_g4346 [Dentipellis fragilis]
MILSLATNIPTSAAEKFADHPGRISGARNVFISYAVPTAVIIIAGLSKAELIDLHHGFLALYSGRALSHIITEALKNRVGRLRPDFLARCAWDTVAAMCTGDPDTVKDGRRSFPSGHSSTAFAGMTFLSLFLAGKTAAWCFAAPAPPGSLAASRLTRLVLAFLPLTFATWVAISRVEDYRHHKEDVIVGSLIGILSSGIAYFIYWPSPFSVESFLPEKVGRPRMVYGEDRGGGRLRNGDYELTGFENEAEAV